MIRAFLSKGLLKVKTCGEKLTVKWKGFSRKRKRILVTGTAIILLAAGSAVIWTKQNTRPVMAENTSVMEVQAETGTISNSIVGTGNLENGEASSVTVPSGVIIDEVKVEAGDVVSKGDVLATVTLSSVYTAMEEVQETIENLDETIEELDNSSEEETVTGKVGGRVKKIYVEEEGDISDTMLEHGALMLLSLDGKMAVEIESSQTLEKGDSVTVSDDDGNELEGEVESVDETTCVITMPDKKVSLDEEVTVSLEGEELGSGKAYIHQQLAITGTTGTVSQIDVEENELISSGDSLYTLLADGDSVEYQEAVTKREAYARTLTELIALAQTGEITADRDGTVESVLVSNSSAASASDSASSVGSTVSAGGSNMAYTGTSQANSGGVQLLNLTAVSESTGSGDTQQGEEETVTGTKLQFTVVSEETDSENTLFLQKPVTGEVPQTVVDSSTGAYSGTVTWTPESESFAAATSYQAQVTLTAAEGYYFDGDSILKLETGILSGIQVSEDKKTITFTVTFPETEEQTEHSTEGNDSQNSTGDENTGGETADGAAGESGSESTGSGTSGNESTGAETNESERTGAGTSGTGNTGTANTGTGNSGMRAGGTGNSGTSGTGITSVSSASASTGDSSEGTAAEDTASEYSTDTTAFTIAGNDEMILSVSVDELDINSVAEGQEAQITFDALENETASGEVTSVSSTGTVNGGVAKYAVEITIPRTEEMKVGMNASATIVIEEKEDVVTIPVNALQERGDQVYVYTETDEEGNLSGEVQVTTGLSDGDTVEITEGLSAGDTVYYQKTGNSSTEQNSGGMRGDDKRSMGNGEMPQGGPGGGGMTPPGN